MEIKLIFSTGKEITLTQQEMAELFGSPPVVRYYMPPTYPIYNPWTGTETTPTFGTTE